MPWHTNCDLTSCKRLCKMGFAKCLCALGEACFYDVDIVNIRRNHEHIQRRYEKSSQPRKNASSSSLFKPTVGNCNAHAWLELTQSWWRFLHFMQKFSKIEQFQKIACQTSSSKFRKFSWREGLKALRFTWVYHKLTCKLKTVIRGRLAQKAFVHKFLGLR